MKVRDADLIDTWAARPDAFEYEPEAVKARYRDFVEARIEELAGGPAEDITEDTTERETEGHDGSYEGSQEDFADQ